MPDDQNFALTPVVVTGYYRFLNTNGQFFKPEWSDGMFSTPERTNLVNRLDMNLSRRNLRMNTNMALNPWQTGGGTDLQAWQAYFRTMFITNYWWPAQGYRTQKAANESEEVIALATNEFPVTVQPQSPAEDVLFALSKFDPAIEELRQASHIPGSRFPLQYDDPVPAEILFPHLASLKSCAQVLQLRACAELAANRQQESFADVKLGLRLPEAIHAEPFKFSLDTRVAMVNLLLQPIWEGLVQNKWTDKQLVGLDAELARLDFLSDCCRAARAECAANIKVIDFCRVTHNAGISCPLDAGEPYPLDERLIFFYYHAFPSGWYYQGEKASARAIMEGILPAVDPHLRIVSPQKVRALIGPMYSAIIGNEPWNFYVQALLPNFSLQNYARIQTAVDCARITCALERFRLAHGVYPDTLDALAPQFIATVPHDVINGQPLHYRRTDHGRFKLYSVGWNEKDDGGTPIHDKFGQVDLSHGDWVWPDSAK